MHIKALSAHHKRNVFYLISKNNTTNFSKILKLVKLLQSKVLRLLTDFTDLVARMFKNNGWELKAQKFIDPPNKLLIFIITYYFKKNRFYFQFFRLALICFRLTYLSFYIQK